MSVAIQKFRTSIRQNAQAKRKPLPEADVSPEYLGKYVEELPGKIERAKHNQFYTIEAKYHSLINTIKPFRDLVRKYKKQLEIFISELEDDYKINKLMQESNYYKEHADYLEKLNSGLDREIQLKKDKEAEVHAIVKERRNQLGQLKVDSIKLKMAIQKKKILLKQKQHVDRPIQEYQPPDCALSEEDRELLGAQKEEFEAEKQLFGKIYDKIMLNELIWGSFSQVREDLHKDQKIVHNQGLAGSMLFKITSARGKENNPIPKPHVVRRMDSDLKFLIYDSLKRKYDAKMAEAKHKDNYTVSYDKFQKFTPLQIIGLMELKKTSLKELQTILADRRRQMAFKYEEA